MLQKSLKSAIVYILLSIILCNCNKNTDQLPPVIALPTKISIPVFVDGLNVVDFVFEQTKTLSSDTVWLSVKNNTSIDIDSMTYVVELCKASPQNYDNCSLQLTAKISQTLKADSTIQHIFSWVNKNIRLDSALINGGIVSYSIAQNSPLSNIYSSSYAVFETDTALNASIYYGLVRGYILSDGKAIFRLKSNDGTNYNASGQFTQLNSFNGLLTKNDLIISPFYLDTLVIKGNKLLINVNKDTLNFRIHLQHPLDDTIHSILVFTQKYY